VALPLHIFDAGVGIGVIVLMLEFSAVDIGCVVLRQGWLLYRFARGNYVNQRKLAAAAIALDLDSVEGRACSSKVSILCAIY
jgi:hypothetical protein